MVDAKRKTKGDRWRWRNNKKHYNCNAPDNGNLFFRNVGEKLNGKRWGRSAKVRPAPCLLCTFMEPFSTFLLPPALDEPLHPHSWTPFLSANQNMSNFNQNFNFLERKTWYTNADGVLRNLTYVPLLLEPPTISGTAVVVRVVHFVLQKAFVIIRERFELLSESSTSSDVNLFLLSLWFQPIFNIISWSCVNTCHSQSHNWDLFYFSQQPVFLLSPFFRLFSPVWCATAMSALLIFV